MRCGEFVLLAKLMVQQREKRMGPQPGRPARVEIKQVVKARIAKPLKDVVEAQTP